MGTSSVNETVGKGQAAPLRLADALREARIEEAELTGVVVDLRDAEAARLLLLNDALDPLFEQIPDKMDLFDRGISHGDTPRLWIDHVAHVAMGRDKRNYRFVQDTRFGRTIIKEAGDAASIVNAVTKYVAQRMVEREKALAHPYAVAETARTAQTNPARQQRNFNGWSFVFGIVTGALALLALAFLASAGR